MMYPESVLPNQKQQEFLKMTIIEVTEDQFESAFQRAFPAQRTSANTSCRSLMLYSQNVMVVVKGEVTMKEFPADVKIGECSIGVFGKFARTGNIHGIAAPEIS
jgi:hypothetical protein